MNYQEIIDALDCTPSEFVEQVEWSKEKDKLEEQFGPIVKVQDIGGGEGEGEKVDRVYHFQAHDVYVRLTGYYSSYEGTEWDADFQQVFPKEKTVIVYE